MPNMHRNFRARRWSATSPRQRKRQLFATVLFLLAGSFCLIQMRTSTMIIFESATVRARTSGVGAVSGAPECHWSKGGAMLYSLAHSRLNSDGESVTAVACAPCPVVAACTCVVVVPFEILLTRIMVFVSGKILHVVVRPLGSENCFIWLCCLWHKSSCGYSSRLDATEDYTPNTALFFPLLSRQSFDVWH